MENKETPTIKLGEFVSQVNDRIGEMQEGIKNDAQTLEKAEVKALTKKSFFVHPNPLWDLWFQKLGAQLISVKIWIITLITILLVTKHITNIQFAAILGTVMAFKGAFSVADVWKRGGTNGNIIDKV
jgi:hypothetical protein